MDSIFSRMGGAYRVVRSTFGAYFSPLVSGGLFAGIRTMTSMGMAVDRLVFPKLKTTQVRRPIVLMGNPRTGTTFLHRFLTEQKFGAGMQLWRMLYPSISLQIVVKPLLPLLEWVSPARHHSTVAHKTGLTSVETDDVSVLFRYFDGFFLYGFFMAFDEPDLLDHFDPVHRDTSERDFAWLDELWRRNLVAQGADRNVAKLFSLAPRVPQFLAAFPDAHLLYMARDPLSVIPSGMSLVTGVLDTRFQFWELPKPVRDQYLERLYGALVQLLRTFTDDWNQGRIDRDRVFIVRYERMMKDFDGLMGDLMEFIDHEPSAAQQRAIDEQTDKQRVYVSKHKYDLDRFGLSEERIRTDCAFFYDTFLPH